MKVYAYQSRSRRNVSLLVLTKGDFSRVPPEKLRTFGEPVFSKGFDLSDDRPRLALDPKEARKNLEKDGYHFQGFKIKFKEKSGST